MVPHKACLISLNVLPDDPIKGMFDNNLICLQFVVERLFVIELAYIRGYVRLKLSLCKSC